MKQHLIHNLTMDLCLYMNKNQILLLVPVDRKYDSKTQTLEIMTKYRICFC